MCLFLTLDIQFSSWLVTGSVDQTHFIIICQSRELAKAWCYIMFTCVDFVMTCLHICGAGVMWRRNLHFFSGTITSCVFNVMGSTLLGWSWSSILQHCNLFHTGIVLLSLFTMGEKKTRCEERPRNSATTPDPNNSISCQWFSYLCISVFTCVHAYFVGSSYVAVLHTITIWMFSALPFNSILLSWVVESSSIVALSLCSDSAAL